jgi:ribonuclease VapC
LEFWPVVVLCPRLLGESGGKTASGNAGVAARRAAYVLDSLAILAVLQAEPGAAQVRAILTNAARRRAHVSMCLVNFGEVVYITEREKGLTAAQIAITTIDQLPIELVPADRALTLGAAHLKARFSLSYADAFAAALARRRAATLLTGDSEFQPLSQIVRIRWLAR